MDSVKIREVARPVICFVLIGGWISMILTDTPVPLVYQTTACLAGLEWITERAIKRFKEIFGG